MAKPRMKADPSDPRCINYPSGVLIGNAFDHHTEKTGELIAAVAKNIGIGAETLYSYARGHSTPTATSREKLEKYLRLKPGALVPLPFEADDGIKTTQRVEGQFLVVTSYIPLSMIGAHQN